MCFCFIKTTHAMQYTGDGTYNLANGDKVKLNNGAIVEPVYGSDSCLISSPCFSVKVYYSNSAYLSQWWIGSTSTLPKEINTGGYRLTIAINNANINNNSWTASMTLTSINEEQCSSFTYSDWSACLNGKKTRTIISSMPSGCTGGMPDLTNYCFNEPIHIGDGTYTIHEDETIKLDNGAMLVPNFSRPINVYFVSFKVYDSNHAEQIGTIYPIRVGTTGPIDTTISNNYRIRVVLNSLDFSNDIWTASVTFTSLYEPLCTSFTYSDWSYCFNNQQWRTVLTSSPTNCIKGNPITTQSCVSPQYEGDGTYTIRNGEKIHLSNGAYIVPGYVQNSQTVNEIILDIFDNNLVHFDRMPSIKPNDPPKNITIGNYMFKISATNASTQNGGTATFTVLSLYDSVPCTSFTYEDWGECTSGWKLRKIVSKYPESCVDRNGLAITRQSCQSENTTNTSTQQSQDISTNSGQTTNTNVNKTLSNRLSGKLLLDVENRGRIFYVNPKDLQRYEVTFANALPLFQKLSLGISNDNLNKISTDTSTALGNKLAGKLLLQVEDRGRIWYIDSNGKKHEVTWTNLMDLFKSLSLGINNENLNKIPENIIQVSSSVDSDNDGLTDTQEALYKTDPKNPDTDADGYKDGEEVNSSYDPLKGDGAKL